ncbi:transmembrane protease serine 2-like [Lycorma delicatula]|uniref:transmembrane protease serine 2-like n=1 Tax=Lycorma delicatula TaxID=130591 RepID=UPI003F5171C1
MYIYHNFIRNVISVWLNNEVSKKPKIIGGEIAKYGEFPYFVSVQRIIIKYSIRSFHVCGGSILTEHVILTARHCCVPSDFKRSVHIIKAGIINLNDNEPNINVVRKCITHPDYDNGTFENDIAVLLPKWPIDFTRRNIPPALYSSKPIEKDRRFSIMGLGQTGESHEVYGNEFRILMQRVRNPYYYKNIFQPYNRITTFCPGGVYGKSACKLDAGDPLPAVV